MLAWAAPLLASGGALGAQVGTSTVEYLYVEANVGSSAGGHVALRVGDRVFDFQNAELGTLRLRRSHWSEFRYVYTVRENRTIHVARVHVPPETRDAILDRFNRRYLIQNKHFAVWEALHRDRELIENLLEDTAPGSRPGSRLRGAGLFQRDADGEAAPPASSSALAALRDRIAKERGADYLARRIIALEREVEALAPPAKALALAGVSRDERPASGYHFSDRYRDLCEKIFALRLLRKGAVLHSDARIAPAAERYALDADEREQLRSFAEAQEIRLARLVASSRPDWGFALIAGMARLQTLRESQRAGQWVFLDAFPADAPVLSAVSVRQRDAFAVELREHALAEFEVARTRWFEAITPGEAQYAWLEETANRDAEFERGFAEQGAVRVYSGRLIPDRYAEVRGLPAPAPGTAVLRSAARAAERRQHTYEAALREAFGYQLTSRNCVTEIFATLDGALHGSGVDRSGEGLNFIPFVSYASVIEANDTAEKLEVPSYRRTRLEAMYTEENDVVVWLRESNTLTSSIYRRNDRDAFFLFFGEGASPVRPALGALNMAAAAGELVLGLLRAPFDRGRTAWSGLKGTVFSLPELFFIDLRKGMLEYAPSDPPRTAMRPAV